MSDDRAAAGTPASLTRKTIVGAGWLLLWRVMTRSLGLVSTLVLARILVPTDFGLLAMATTFSQGVEALSQLGLQDALVRRHGDGMDLHHAAFTLQLGRAVVTAAAILAGAPAAAWWFSEPRLIPVLLVLAGATAISGFENVGISEFRRDMRFDVQFKLLSVPRLVQFAATVSVALVWRSYWALLVGIVVSRVMRTVMTYRVHPFRPRLRLTHWRKLAGFSFWTWAASMAKLFWDRCDPFVLGPVLGSAALGLYVIGLDIAILPVTELIAPAADALFAAFSRAQKDGTTSIHLAPEVACVVLLGVVPAVLTISAASGPIVEVMLGPKWSAAWPVVAVLTWSCVFSPFSYICSMALVANGYVRRNFIGNAAVSAIKLAVLLVAVSLTRNLTFIGAAIAACVATESMVFLLLLRGIRGVRLRGTARSLLRAVLATVAALLSLWQSGLGWRPAAGGTMPDLTRGILIGAIATAVFAAADLLLWQVSGRPEGPEARLLRMAGGYLASTRLRTRRA
jgi:O-antigen/teichoic acid export membrane protein